MQGRKFILRWALMQKKLKAAIEQGRKLKARCLPPAENPLTLPDNVYQGFPKEFQKYTFLNRIPEFVLEQREIHQLETA